MKLQNKRWYPYIFLIGCITVGIIWYLFVPSHKPEIIISLIGTVGGFTYFFYSQHLNETKLLKDLIVEFNQRYAVLSVHLNAVLFGQKEGLLSETEREYIFSYFNLCAEEFFFYKAGYIDDNVWKAWSSGMKVFFKHPRIRTLWEEDCVADSYYGFRPPV